MNRRIECSTSNFQIGMYTLVIAKRNFHRIVSIGLMIVSATATLGAYATGERGILVTPS